MIREEFLENVSRSNLVALKTLRDIAYFAESASAAEGQTLIEYDRVLTEIRILTMSCIRFAHGFVRLDRDGAGQTKYTARADRALCAVTGFAFDAHMYEELAVLESETVVGAGTRGSLFELQIRLCGGIAEAGGRLSRLLAAKRRAGGLQPVPAYVLEALGGIAGAFAYAAAQTGKERYTAADIKPDWTARILYFAECALDPFSYPYERERIGALAPVEKAEALLTLGLDEQKGYAPPLLADICYRMLLHSCEGAEAEKIDKIGA